MKSTSYPPIDRDAPSFISSETISSDVYLVGKKGIKKPSISRLISFLILIGTLCTIPVYDNIGKSLLLDKIDFARNVNAVFLRKDS